MYTTLSGHYPAAKFIAAKAMPNKPMENSRFREILEKDIRSSGSYAVLSSPAYSLLVKKTIITKITPETAEFVWLDAEGKILAQCLENSYSSSALPRLGKVEEHNKRAEYQRKYGKTTKQFHLRLTSHDQDIIDRLEQCDNIQGFIKSLVRKEIEREKKEKGRQ